MLRTIISRITAVLIIIVSIIIIYRTIQENNSEKLLETTVPTQIDFAEEFNGVLFGMTMEDVIKTLNSQPDYIHSNSCVCWYNNVVYLNVNTACMEYWFEDNGKLREIDIRYEYSDEFEKERQLTDYAVIKEELLKRYPEEIRTDYSDDDEYSSFKTENRRVSLYYMDDAISVSIWPVENTDPTDSSEQ